jgi:asparagine synthase (glutamine-hydrolysing)
MSGIAGIVTAPDAPPPDAATLAALERGIAHRGPDGSGQTVVGRVALVHKRLATVDLDTGGQPLFAGAAALVGTGTIFNAGALRADMQGARFATDSDNEVPLHAWARDGAAFAGRLRGMYALAIHDRAGRTVTLARDPFGIKPLYIAQTGAGLAFASEARALLAAGIVPRAVRPAARDELLQIQFTTGAETIFPGIRRVLPGETLVCADGRIIERHRIEALPPGPPEEPIDEDAALARLDHALTESVGLHQRSDVPCGMFLSGGIDSAAILTVMARLNSSPVLAFTAGFDAPGAADQRLRAADIARALGARHETLDVTETDVWRHLPEIVACMDDPAADYAIIPAWFLARRARADVKVVLSGEGGDEMFAGYGRYRSAMRPWWLGGRVMRGRGTFDRLDVLRVRPPAWRDGLAAAEAQASAGGRTRLQVAQATDMADWLPHDQLLKLDRCLTAHAVEGRAPFLDEGVAAAAFRLPDALKVRKDVGKWLLRRWLDSNCPAACPFARRHGVAVPIGAWIGGVGERLGPLVAAQPGVAEVAEPGRVAALFRRAADRRAQVGAWHLLFYALWHRAHIEARAPEGDMFEFLAAR